MSRLSRYYSHGLTAEAMFSRLLDGMSVVACGVFDGDVILACDGAADSQVKPRREDAVKFAPVNESWAVGFFGNTLFLHRIAPAIWGIYHDVADGDMCRRIYSAGRSLWRTDVDGDAAIDLVDRAVHRYSGELLPYLPDTVVFLAGISSRGPEVYERSAYDGMAKRKAVEEYGFVHRVAVPGGGVGPCRMLCNAALPFEERLRTMLSFFSDYTTVNENLAMTRHSTGWALEGRNLAASEDHPD